MAKKNTCDPSRELWITNIKKEMRDDLDGCSDYRGISITEFLAPLITDIVNSYPDHLKEDKKCEKAGYIRVRGISAKTKRQLHNIAEHIGVDKADIIKLGIAGKMEAQPDYMKKFKKLDY